MLSEKLKQHTQSNHQALEKTLVSQLKVIRSKEEYIRLITAFYSYFGGLELFISAALNRSILVDYDGRRKTERLKDDLLYFKASIPDLADKESLPVIQTSEQAIGALYVIEGSTLGGQIICKMLAPLRLSPDAGLSFFSGYGHAAIGMWEEFKTSIDRANLNDDEVLKTANKTFELFSRWFDRDEFHIQAY